MGTRRLGPRGSAGPTPAVTSACSCWPLGPRRPAASIWIVCVSPASGWVASAPGRQRVLLCTCRTGNPRRSLRQVHREGLCWQPGPCPHHAQILRPVSLSVLPLGAVSELFCLPGAPSFLASSLPPPAAFSITSRPLGEAFSSCVCSSPGSDSTVALFPAGFAHYCWCSPERQIVSQRQKGKEKSP